MNIRFALSAVALACMTLGTAAQAADISGAVGQTDDGSMTYRAGVQFNFTDSWLQSDTGHLGGYWDAGYSYWEGGNGSSGNHSLSFSPVFVYEFAGQNVRPIIEAGIGVALFSDTEVDGNQLSTAFQFEDRLGLGLRFSGQEIGVRAIHYSNAGIKEPNDGVESYSLYYRTAL
ncbi:acyloxyacyl hydrolase [Pseudomonas sp. N040]|uniref:acyloxyacyl hydrolase n=1 Tax=Pseudomonas sp. N040 TaxID=2785325 RepID=UPI0018A31021|nr:acyloxyacyl hydrolase [Pseudomonas sp. N040]MBF7730591.1 acyloxyacyl hydrolase [Pseudomonas sp. N040]MBW7014235.1 acyloxyacyl hydrolase [Pseudomonas sp. N040]